MSAAMPLQVVLGQRRLDGVYFVKRRTPAVAATPFEPAPPSAGVEHVATDDVGRTAHIRIALLTAILGAERKVLFCSFLFADDAIVKALCAAAHRLRGGVYVLTALSKHERPDMLEPDAEIDARAEQQQKRDARHEGHLRDLAQAGVWLRSAEDCHAKFCVVDDDVCVVTSANATEQAYERNPESGFCVRSREVSAELARLFAHVWLHQSTIDSTPGRDLDVHEYRRAAAPAWSPLRSLDGVTPVATLGKQEPSLLKRAISTIDAAREDLTIATYSFVGMPEHPVGDALSRALRRGVRLRMLLQPRNHVEEQRKSCAWLVGVGGDAVTLVGHAKTHAKSLVADRRQVLLWTGNLDGEHGWESGVEVGIWTDRQTVASTVGDYIESVMARATHDALVAPTADELAERGEALGLEGAWTLELPHDADAASLHKALASEPVDLVELREGQGIRIARRLVLSLERAPSTRTLHVRAILDARTASAARGAGLIAGCTLTLATRAPAPHPPARPPHHRRRQ